MRGMFAAISGLKQHQSMLDVTANDIANVNTIGYKSARVTFQDSLTQLQRGASGPTADQRRLQRRAGRPRRRPRLDRQPDDRRRAPDDRQPARRRDPGRRLLPVGRAARRPAADSPIDADRLHPRGQLLDQLRGYLTTQDGQYVLGYAQPTAAGADRRRDQDPGRRHRRRDRPVRRRLLRRPGDRHARVTPYRLTLATFPNAAGLERTGGNRWMHLGQLRRRRPSTRRATAARASRTAGAVEMSNVDLAQTFTNMITAQRGFQANSRVISTADEMLQDLVNLKR